MLAAPSQTGQSNRLVTLSNRRKARAFDSCGKAQSDAEEVERHMGVGFSFGVVQSRAMGGPFTIPITCTVGSGPTSVIQSVQPLAFAAERTGLIFNVGTRRANSATLNHTGPPSPLSVIPRSNDLFDFCSIRGA